MNQRPVPSTLVNFRMPKALLEPFDDICFLSGKTRTQALLEMIHNHVDTVGSKIVGTVYQSITTTQELRNSALKIRAQTNAGGNRNAH